jgi:hypothetical protein
MNILIYLKVVKKQYYFISFEGASRRFDHSDLPQCKFGRFLAMLPQVELATCLEDFTAYTGDEVSYNLN